MLIPNPNKLITSLDIAIDYWGHYKSEDNVNYRYNKEPYIQNKQIVISDLKSNIYGVLKDNDTPISIKYITTMIHNLCNELSTNRYYVVPFEQLISFLDISQYLYADYNLYALSIKLTQENKDISYLLDKPVNIIVSKNYNIERLEKIHKNLIYYNLPIIYYAIHNYEQYLNTKDQRYLPIPILFRKLLFDYIDIFTIDKVNDKKDIKVNFVENSPNYLDNIVNYFKDKLK